MQRGKVGGRVEREIVQLFKIRIILELRVVETGYGRDSCRRGYMQKKTRNNRCAVGGFDGTSNPQRLTLDLSVMKVLSLPSLKTVWYDKKRQYINCTLLKIPSGWTRRPL